MPPTVALFITCLTDQFYPQVGVAITKILEHYGCRVEFPDAQTCCGQPFYNNGFHAEAEPIARRFVEIFEPFDAIVTPSGSCCAMIRQHVPELFKTDDKMHARAKSVAAKTFEFTEYLSGQLRVDFGPLKLPNPESMTYHYTCHLRGLGIRDDGAKLVSKLGNVDFRPLEKSDQCCGFGGTFALKYPQISGAMVEDKVANIRATGAATTICNDAGCTMNIAGMCHRAGVATQVKHVAEVLADALGLDVTRW